MDGSGKKKLFGKKRISGPPNTEKFILLIEKCKFLQTAGSQTWAYIPEFAAREPAFLISPQVLLMLLVQGLHLDIIAVDSLRRVETQPVCGRGIHLGSSIQGAGEKGV